MITDGIRAGGARAGDCRITELLRHLVPAAQLANQTNPQLLTRARQAGLFVGTVTCEPDLVRGGSSCLDRPNLVELAPGPTARQRAEAWMATPATLNREQFLKDIEEIGKGRLRAAAMRATRGRTSPSCRSRTQSTMSGALPLR